MKNLDFLQTARHNVLALLTQLPLQRMTQRKALPMHVFKQSIGLEAKTQASGSAAWLLKHVERLTTEWHTIVWRAR
jgi:hypothetical protein